MQKLGGTKSGVVTIGVTLLLAFVVFPALSGAASATSASGHTSPAVAATPWAYCGNGSWDRAVTSGNATFAWNASFAWCTIFHATSTGPGVWMLELNRTLGMKIVATLSSPVQSAKFSFAAQEVDAAFANVTNGSTVYVGGQPVPALGLLNASTFDQSSIDQSMSDTQQGATASAALSVKGNANASVAFDPSLGLIPLNLTGVTAWNSTSMASASAAWQVDWTWSRTPFNGTPVSGSESHSGNLSGSFVVQLLGSMAPVYPHPFMDGKTRAGVVLMVQGPFDLRDGFVLVPHGFDLFGGASQAFDPYSMGSATVGSGETLYLTQGVGGPQLTAAASQFGANDLGSNSVSAMNLGGTVVAQPVSVAQAQSEASQISGQGTTGTVAHPLAGAFLLGVIVAAVVTTVLGVLGWRSYARRRASAPPVGGYTGYGPDGVPPAVVSPPSAAGPTEPVLESEAVHDPNRRP